MNKKFYITTSIAYTNSKPHIGYALELVQADVVARAHREVGEDVFFLTGTDDHGIKIENSAKVAGITPEKFVQGNIELFKHLTKELDISNNDFISTLDEKKHWPGAIALWNKLVEKDAIYLTDYEGWYCEGCEAFVNPRDLIDGNCPNHKKKPELVKEKNYFFALSKYKNDIVDAILGDKLQIVPAERKNEILNIIKDMEDVSFSRPIEKLTWGIPVPGDPKQVMYVWCDALSNYITALGYGTKNEKLLKKYWPADIQVIGKDILKFHAAIWPAMLLAAGLELPKKLFVHGFVTSEGQKMSKSLGNVVDPFDIIKKYGTDALRYYLLREIPTTGDGDFSAKRFEEVYNGELANELGNLVNRTITLLSKQKDFHFVLGHPSYALDTTHRIIHPRSVRDATAGRPSHPTPSGTGTSQNKNLSAFKFNDILKNIWKDIRESNEYVEHNKPWELAKTNPEKLKKVLEELAHRLSLIANNLKPFLPETSENIQKQLKTLKPEVLFPRIK